MKRSGVHQAESSVSVCENEKIRTTQGRGSTQFQLSYNTKTLESSSVTKPCKTLPTKCPLHCFKGHFDVRILNSSI